MRFFVIPSTARNLQLLRAILTAAVIACATRGALAQSPPPSGRTSADPARGTFYIGTYAKKILVMDESTLTVKDSIPLSWVPLGMQLSFDRKRLYVRDARNETVDIIDIAARKSVGTFSLSTPERRVRLNGMNVDPTERFAVLLVKTYTKKPDRFEVSRPMLLRYDLEKRVVTDTIPWPRGEERDFAQIIFSPRGDNLYFFTSDDVLIYDTRTLKQVDRWELSRTFFEDGYGRINFGFFTDLNEAPGFYTNFFRVTDPVNRRNMMGVARVNLVNRTVDFYTLGPSAPVFFTIAPDRKRAYGLRQEVGNYQFWTIDLEQRRVVGRMDFKGRPRMALVAGTDGKHLYVMGAGSTIDVYDAQTFQLQRTVDLEADMIGFMLVPPGPGPARPAP